MIWKSHRFVSFWANLTYFEVKPDIPGLHHLLSSLLPTTYTGISDLAYCRTDWHQVKHIVGHKVGVGVGVGVRVGVRVGVGVEVGLGVGVEVGE